MLGEIDASTLGIGSALFTSLCGLILTILNLYWTKGSESRIAEAKANAEIAASDASKLKAIYEQRLVVVEAEKADLRSRLAAMQAHIDIIDGKLDAAEQRERDCLTRAAKMEGKLEVLERKANAVSAQVDKLASQPQPDLKEAVKEGVAETKVAIREGVHDVKDAIHTTTMQQLEAQRKPSS